MQPCNEVIINLDRSLEILFIQEVSLKQIQVFLQDILLVKRTLTNINSNPKKSSSEGK